MHTRRNLLKSGAFLAGMAGASGLLPASVQKAFAISPDPGTTYLDAEHIVILMQENRSFDHMFGTLKGVRGFNDRRTIRQGDGTSVFIQRDVTGKAYTPWHVSLTETKITWMGDTPHSRSDHLDAWNGGTYSNWVTAKTNRRYPDVPVTMAYHTRQDLPFYYALADAFTVCDQHFCGSLTETAPNRLHMWSGTLREPHGTGSLAYLKNGQTHPGALAWTSFPERLEKAGISWRCYQNDSYCETPLSPDEQLWLGNDGDNTMERFAAVKPQFSPRFKEYTLGVLDDWQTKVRQRRAELEKQLAALAPNSPEAESIRGWLSAYTAQDKKLQKKRSHGNADFAKLNEKDRSIHSKVFTNNSSDPNFRTFETIQFEEGGRQETMQVPKGDVLHQFRSDARNGKLPTVSWLVAAANFSAHPGAPFYGAWYISEVMDILTENPELWKKTIFIVSFDENDGLFDHVPPFVACDPKRPETGKVSEGLNPAQEYAYAEDERIQGTAEKDVRDGPIGLGYRVPMIIMSPWSRGGWVNSQVFEHSSIIQFVENFVEKKFGKNVRQKEISTWRRAVSGDLTTCFHPYDASHPDLPFLERNDHLVAIEKARFKPLPDDFQEVERSAYATPQAEARLLNETLWQEEGVRPACALPYELSVQGNLSPDHRFFEIAMTAGNALFGNKASGAPFNIYLHGVKDGSQTHSIPGVPANVAVASYAVKSGDTLRDRVDMTRFSDETYDIEVYGPNGFFRQFTGKRTTSTPEVICTPKVRKLGEKDAWMNFAFHNPADKPLRLRLVSAAYFKYEKVIELGAGQSTSVSVDLKDGDRWYDLLATGEGMSEFRRRYAGRVETGAPGISDPMIGNAATFKNEV